MLSGESLTVFLFLVGAVLTAVIGAITAPLGWRSNCLWGLAGALALATAAWLLAPAASPVFAAIRPIAVALVESNALAMVGIVGIVALMVGGRPAKGQSHVGLATLAASETARLPAFASSNHSKWTPDFTFKEALVYLGTKSLWAARMHRTVDETRDTLIDALRNGKLTAWGKEHPQDAVAHQIGQAFWIRATVTLETNYAFSENRSAGVYEVQFSEGELKMVWPAKPDPAAE